MEKLGRFGKVWNVGHRGMQGLFDEEVEVTEKLDGSQFSFGVFDGELYMRSRRKVIYANEANLKSIFKKAINTVIEKYQHNLLLDSVVYRAEALNSPKHNTLTYDRIPEGGLAVYGMEWGDKTGDYEKYYKMKDEVEYAGMECVPLLFRGILTEEKMKELLETESMLGGPKIEGVVAARHKVPMFDPGGIPVRAKFVSEAFKEKHLKGWPKKPGKTDIVERIRDIYSVEARWRKCVQHMRDEGVLQQAPQDIGPLIRRVQNDVMEEASDEIKEILWKEYNKNIIRSMAKGIPQWYKEELAKEAF